MKWSLIKSSKLLKHESNNSTFSFSILSYKLFTVLNFTKNILLEFPSIPVIYFNELLSDTSLLSPKPR